MKGSARYSERLGFKFILLDGPGHIEGGGIEAVIANYRLRVVKLFGRIL